ncbi:Pentapeptide repeats (8 copies) [Posidoniimonas corsicana]|uniref:Pentapeptide repeats (8 copies) n=1 Tax=Posidoniimonas corsicana TaxID=1938618 RepID=A0A5C5VF43_9BACT|nr:pentapeptide repeat-containing protein [Posidoniimonas corsicana]TWT36663.1 Pentapeptide repeats (8 copies) [Posidoniimonas corsicana]
MTAPSSEPKKRWRFSLRSTLTGLLLVALLLGWRASLLREKSNAAKLMRENAHLRGELQNKVDRLEVQLDAYRDLREQSHPLSIDTRSLRGMQITSSGNIFQAAFICGFDLSGAQLTGGGSAFQLAHFDESNLAGATLAGGGGSFQEASFENADLTNATLTGGSASFQGASFSRANLTGARINVSATSAFQQVNLTAAQCQGADLSALDSQSLASCYFDDPPTYDGQTRFPAGFNPREQGWELVE